MIPLHGSRIPRRGRYTPEQLVREVDDKLGEATREIVAPILQLVSSSAGW